MLARARLSDDAPLAHALRQKDLTKRVVYFMSASVKQIFALEINARATRMFGQTPCEEKRSWPAGVITQ